MASTISEPLPTPILTTGKCIIRAFTLGDAEAMAAAANFPEISMYMRNRFPYPYTLENSKFWIDFCVKGTPMTNFGIFALDGTFAGSIGLTPGQDIEYRTWEVGYWVAKHQWGKGIATTALKAFSEWAFKEFPELLRLEAGVFEGNNASMKVLEKVGYVREGIRRKAICKRDKVLDQVLFSLLREDVEGL
ncbi:hypothetical protein M434DRAFT_398828 [Hypoxylon sp. CO27-5]|nr:hypothetical protein M434DRAFT_398828 [Hypoxylon sp. CO27-5]